MGIEQVVVRDYAIAVAGNARATWTTPSRTFGSIFVANADFFEPAHGHEGWSPESGSQMTSGTQGDHRLVIHKLNWTKQPLKYRSSHSTRRD
jgi:hypothetical protein